jgi:F-type H+-transporting ATPase subunit b
MSATRRLLSIAVLGAALLAGHAALAQPEAGGEAKPEHGFAPPSDETPPTGETGATGATAGAAHGGHIDPSRHFNFADMSWKGKDELDGKFGDGVMVDQHTGTVVREEEPKSAPFIFMVLNFVLLLVLLAWKGGPVASKLAAERHDQIKSALDESAKLRKQAADRLAEYESRLKEADAEIKKMVEGIRIDAEADKKRILEAAEKQAAQMKRDAELRIAAEIDLARTALTREVTAAATAATEQLLRDKVTPGDQQQLVAGFISDLQGGKPSREVR